MTQDVQLSEAQLAVMRALWRAGEAPTARVVEQVGRDRRLAYTTVATMLSRLEKRGLVVSRQEGREKVYRPLVSEDEVQTAMVSGLVSRLFQGDPAALVSHLVRRDEIDEGDLERVRAMLQDEDDGKR